MLPARRARIFPVGVAVLALACAGEPGSAQVTEVVADGGVAETHPPAEVAEEAPESAPQAGPPPVPVPAPAAGGAPGVGLDSLLRLPSDRTYTVERRGGRTRGEWRARIREARDAVEAEKAALAAAEARLDQAASDGANWQVAPPIPGQDAAANPGETTQHFKLRQEIRRHRDEIKRLERRLLDVETEANLAGVPADWAD